jgi:hypothetical protein
MFAKTGTPHLGTRPQSGGYPRPEVDARRAGTAGVSARNGTIYPLRQFKSESGWRPNSPCLAPEWICSCRTSGGQCWPLLGVVPASDADMFRICKFSTHTTAWKGGKAPAPGSLAAWQPGNNFYPSKSSVRIRLILAPDSDQGRKQQPRARFRALGGQNQSSEKCYACTISPADGFALRKAMKARAKKPVPRKSNEEGSGAVAVAMLSSPLRSSTTPR